jgi:hypothetical protein
MEDFREQATRVVPKIGPVTTLHLCAIKRCASRRQSLRSTQELPCFELGFTSIPSSNRYLS